MVVECKLLDGPEEGVGVTEWAYCWCHSLRFRFRFDRNNPSRWEVSTFQGLTCTILFTVVSLSYVMLVLLHFVISFSAKMQGKKVRSSKPTLDCCTEKTLEISFFWAIKTLAMNFGEEKCWQILLNATVQISFGGQFNHKMPKCVFLTDLQALQFVDLACLCALENFSWRPHHLVEKLLDNDFLCKECFFKGNFLRNSESLSMIMVKAKISWKFKINKIGNQKFITQTFSEIECNSAVQSMPVTVTMTMLQPLDN